MTETQLQKDIRDYFTAAGWLVVRIQAGTSRGGRMHHAPKGFPDLLALGPDGDVVFVEVKLPGHIPTPEQDKMGQRLVKMGHCYGVLTSVRDAEAVVKLR